MSREIDLIKYLPDFMQQFLQLRLISEVESEKLQEILSELCKIDNNQYILTADSDGLKRYEKMLGISVEQGDTLESRRKRVLNKWNDQDTYTYSTFLKKLDLICGAGNYQIVEHFKQYFLELYTDLRECGEMAELENIVDYMLPCNMVLHLSNEMKWDSNALCCTKIVSSVTERFECSDNIYMAMNVDGNYSFGGAATSIFILDIKERQ